MTSNPALQSAAAPAVGELVPVGEVGDAGVAALAEVASLLADDGPRQARIAVLLGRIITAGTCESVLGVDVDLWLSQVCRLPRVAARRVTRTATTLGRLPALAAATAAGQVCWAQTQTICAAAAGLRTDRLAALDQAIAGLVDEQGGWEPDVLIEMVDDEIAATEPTRVERDEAAAERGAYVAMEPFLGGGGGRFNGTLGTVGYAGLSELLDTDLPPPPAKSSDPDLDGLPESQLDQWELDEREQRAWQTARHYGAHRATRLIRLIELALAARIDLDTTSNAGDGDANRDRDGESTPDDDGNDRDGDGSRDCDRCGDPEGQAERLASAAAADLTPAVGLLATISVETLLERDTVPGALLTTLTGGRLRASTGLIRRLLATRACELTTVILDDTGQALGVGRTTRHPPGWLRAAVLARDQVDTAPGSSVPGRCCDIDHLTEVRDHGPTDAPNLALTGRRRHTQKTARSWQVTRDPHGTTTWHHHRSRIAIARPPTHRRLTDPPPHRGPPRPPPPTREPDG